MGEENKLFSGANRLFFAPKDTAEFKELPVMENTTVIGFDEGKEIPPRKFSFSCNVEMSDEDRAAFDAECKPVMIANKMREDINRLVKSYGSLRAQSKLNRKERREREREIKKKYDRFVAYCKANNIQFDIKHGE